MTVADYVLEGLAEALELERELGVRVVEIDRALLQSGGTSARPPVQPVSDASAAQRGRCGYGTDASAAQPAAVSLRSVVRGRRGDGADQRPSAAETSRTAATVAAPSLVFIHDRPLSPGGIEMMAKIVTALGLTDGQAPIVVEPPIPNAKMFVFLGFRALRRYMPAMRIEENTWGKSPKGKDILVVKSPEEILRFDSVTPAVDKMKKDMWRSLKAVKQRLALS